MQVTDELLQKLARLSQLQFAPEEEAQVKEDLEKMIVFIDKLKEVDTTSVPPLMHISSAVNVLRDDVPGAQLAPEDALRNAPLHDGQFFLVPKVLKKGDT